MNRDYFVKRRKHPNYLKLVDARKGNRRGASVNDCFKPSAEASKADLVEYHREEMGLRRRRQRTRIATVRLVPTGSIATGNRRGGPHLHQREIGRRLKARA